MLKYSYALTLLLGLIFFSCTEENPEFGTELIDDVNISFEGTDTLAMLISTVKYDTLVTSNTSRILVGRSADTVQRPGTVVASGFFQLGASSNNIVAELKSSLSNIEVDFEFDSVTFQMPFEGYSLGDTTKPVTYKLFQLSEVISYIKGDSGFLYSCSSFDFDQSNPIGSVTKLPKPSGDTIKLRLPNLLGQTVFNWLADNSSNALSPNELRDSLRGFGIIAEQDHEFMAGFRTDGVEMIIYYHDAKSPTPVARSLSFVVRQDARSGNFIDPYFSKFDVDFKGTSIETISEPKGSLTSTLTDDVSFIGGARGLAVKIELPTLYDFFDKLEEGQLLGSNTITLKPQFLEGTTPFELRDTWSDLTVSKIDANNNIIRTYPEASRLSLDLEFDVDTKYVINITSFIMEQLADVKGNKNAILLELGASGRTRNIESLVIGGENNSELAPEILINTLKRNDK